MTLKDIITDVKFWIAVIVLVAGGILGYLKFQALPERVQKVEIKTEDNKDNLNKLAGTVDIFITEQRVIQQEANKREDLMLKLIEKKR